MIRSLLLASSLTLVALASACSPSASFQFNVDLGSFNLDSEVRAFEDAACKDAIAPSCAVLSALADVPFAAETGPSERPSLPEAFPATIAVDALDEQIDVADWYVGLSQQRIDEAQGPCDGSAENDDPVDGCSFGHRLVR